MTSAADTITSAGTQNQTAEVIGNTPPDGEVDYTGHIIVGLIVIAYIIFWMGWTTFVTVVLWAVVIIAGIGAVGSAIYASTTEDKDDVVGAWVVASVSAVVGVGVWFFIPADQASTSVAEDVTDTTPISEPELTPRQRHPNQKFVEEVFMLFRKEPDRSKLTSVPVMVRNYRSYGIALRGVSDVKVAPELVDAVQNWSAASIDFSHALADYANLPGQDQATVEGVTRLLLGEPPVSVLNREATRVTERDTAWKRVESALTRLEVAKADFSRETTNILTTEQVWEVLKKTLTDEELLEIAKKARNATQGD